jgi:hypothetical protein
MIRTKGVTAQLVTLLHLELLFFVVCCFFELSFPPECVLLLDEKETN